MAENRTEIDYELLQAAFAVLVSIDALEEAGELERMRTSSNLRVQELYGSLMTSRQRLVDSIGDEADRRAEKKHGG